MKIALLIGMMLVSAQQESPPAGLEQTAAQLRKTGAEVRLGQGDDRKWEIWLDHKGPITDETLKPLNAVKGLASIRIFSDDLTDRRLAGIKDLPDLHLLVVMSDKLTDACTVPISKLSGLVKLDINKGTLTQKGLKRLQALKRLERLYLYNAKIKDVDLAPLREMKQLRVLDLPSTASDQTFAEFRKALPKTEVSVRREP